MSCSERTVDPANYIATHAMRSGYDAGSETMDRDCALGLVLDAVPRRRRDGYAQLLSRRETAICLIFRPTCPVDLEEWPAGHPVPRKLGWRAGTYLHPEFSIIHWPHRLQPPLARFRHRRLARPRTIRQHSLLVRGAGFRDGAGADD